MIGDILRPTRLQRGLLVANGIALLVNGKQGIHDAWAELLGPMTLDISWKANKVDVARSGELAYLIGSYEMTVKDPNGKSVTDLGKFVEVWKKQSDGKWKCVADIFNSDLTPPPEKK